MEHLNINLLSQNVLSCQWLWPSFLSQEDQQLVSLMNWKGCVLLKLSQQYGIYLWSEQILCELWWIWWVVNLSFVMAFVHYIWGNYWKMYIPFRLSISEMFIWTSFHIEHIFDSLKAKQVYDQPLPGLFLALKRPSSSMAIWFQF